jgi:hypothetical protein
VRPNGNYGGGQLRRRISEHRPLGETEVRPTHGGEAAGKQRLDAKPGNGVGAVLDFSPAGLELAAGTESATHALQDNVIAARCVSARRLECGQWTATVRPTDEDRARSC